MKLVSLSLFIPCLAVLLIGVQAEDTPCTTPDKKSGSCVPTQRCRNIHRVENNPVSPPTKVANYIRLAKQACDRLGASQSVCCPPQEVVDSSTAVTNRPPRSCPTGSTRGARQNLLSQDCGKLLTDRLAHGNQTRVFSFPWMAVIRYDESGQIRDGCGGSLINERYVLTAAHCIKTKSYQKLHSVVLGDHTKEQDEDCNIYENAKGVVIDRECAGPTEIFTVESHVIHEDYGQPKYRNDIGLLRLDRDVTMKDHIQPICLPVTDELRRQQFDKYILSGWGVTEHGSPSKVLMEATLPRVDNPECQTKLDEKRLNIKLGSKQMCAGGINKVDACSGDSGGPLGSYATYRGSRFVQYGIVSTGVNTCGSTNIPGVYCRVADYMDWILDKMQPSC